MALDIKTPVTCGRLLWTASQHICAGALLYEQTVQFSDFRLLTIHI